MQRWRNTPLALPSVRGLSIFATVTTRGSHPRKVSSGRRCCNANLPGEDEARWLLSHSSSEARGDAKGPHGVNQSVSSLSDQ